jgi:hypothetical protein
LKKELRNILAIVAVCALFLTASAPAKAQFVTKTEVAEVVGAIVGAGALIVVGIFASTLNS